ncbi:TIGR03862 family flavoprotein [Hydrogenophaga laconesensis]|uniref:Flavoprotein (TIGR03862 family) n=1 Tax=Hydrogenophaga laconesensis TaxID=1805971 RepID=A0ABU1VF82_9BURK|nr:TIGR03862 family flavoprotein [Hydrogenophaga laconesensis]MDR7096134.1 putative flavoprotein (TIGR03862 family) [Hydrogenophaga laconesensis]
MTDFSLSLSVDAAVIGGGPAGLMAAECLSRAGLGVHLFDAMPSVGRKFLLAGKGGMNLTHAEALPAFLTRYGERAAQIGPLLDVFGPQAVRDWADGLGIATFVGSSQRVFPTDMKAAPLLRAWLQRLRHPAEGGVAVGFHMRHRWTGWHGDALCFETPQGPLSVRASATLLALGGASWARLGSDGAWVAWLREQGVEVASLQPSNCGFDVAGGWTPFFAERFAGQPFKSVAIRATDSQGRSFHRKGEFVATATGVEGSLIYAVSALLRDDIQRHGRARFELDLLPDRSPEQVLAQVSHPRGSRSLSSHLKSRLGLDGIRMAIVNELIDKTVLHEPARLAMALKAVPVTVVAARPIDEAISSAGGVCWEGLDGHLMVKARPGLFCAGEMLDWEAPTGGYLLTACLASGVVAGEGARRWLQRRG